MACTRRDRSNTPVQALTLLNDATFFQSARGLARRIIALSGTDKRAPGQCVSHLSGPPAKTAGDRNAAALLRSRGVELAATAARPAQLPEATGLAGGELGRAAAWTLVCRALLNLDEFMTRE